MSRRVHFVMADELVARIDAAALGVSRGEFVRQACEWALEGRDFYLATPADAAEAVAREGRGERFRGAMAPLAEDLSRVRASAASVAAVASRRHLPNCGCPVCKPAKGS